ncbi:1,2-phenylacetyl-CoA epoxidase subunit PaaC [Luteococcus sp. OSA5]|uniref:1,2-phenylacetyl-CoA epoxidase subunit PaaC n=1 Tax=Luteococcus sp. OSA5 TaxID=3401630 RepID=UPI003B42BF26
MSEHIMSVSSDSATKMSVGEGITAEQIQEDGTKASEAAAQYALMLGDDALILSQRLGWWISRAPELEEDIALGNIALDLVGHARFLLSYAGTAWGKTEDELAYFRDEEEFRSCRLVEQPNGDFGQTIARQLFYSHFAYAQYEALLGSSDQTLAAIAAKAVKEVAYHRDHADQWVLRLGDGTEESHRRMQEALDAMWPYVEELFEDLEVHRQLDGAVPLPSSLRERVLGEVTAVIERATLQVPTTKQAMSDQRTGAFSEYRGYILAEMQVLARQHPGATW